MPLNQTVRARVLAHFHSASSYPAHCCRLISRLRPEELRAEAWKFAISGDSRNCGDIVMPAIAAGVRSDGAEFYWHLGDYRAMSNFDEDYRRTHPDASISQVLQGRVARLHPAPACALRRSAGLPGHRQSRTGSADDARHVHRAVCRLAGPAGVATATAGRRSHRIIC